MKMVNPYKPFKTKLMIIKCLLRADKPLIANHIAKRTRLNPQTVAYQLNKMVENGILLKDNDHYHPQDYFSNKELYGAFYSVFHPFVDAIKNSTDSSQMKDDNILEILRILVELFMLDLFK